MTPKGSHSCLTYRQLHIQNLVSDPKQKYCASKVTLSIYPTVILAGESFDGGKASGDTDQNILESPRSGCHQLPQALPNICRVGATVFSSSRNWRVKETGGMRLAVNNLEASL